MKFIQLQHNEIANSTTSVEIILWIESIESPENIGSIFRIAEAMGVKNIYWHNCTIDIQNKKITRIARNTNKNIISHKTENYTQLQLFKQENHEIIALELTTNAQPLYETIWSEKTVLIIGNEKSGVSQEALSFCNKVVYIPMYGKNSSINVATALGICLNDIQHKYNFPTL